MTTILLATKYHLISCMKIVDFDSIIRKISSRPHEAALVKIMANNKERGGELLSEPMKA